MRNTAIFILCVIIGFGLGYLFFEMGDREQAVEENHPVEEDDTVNEKNDETGNQSDEGDDDTSQGEQASSEAQILSDKGCISCHSVSALNLQGGATGPDLSNAYANVEDKHGKPLGDFLQEPTSAVMTSVISGNPLTDEERTEIVEVLKKASEQ